MERKRKVIIASVFVIALLLVTIGVSFAFFNYVGTGQEINTVETGTLSFVYDETLPSGNSIALINAFPMSDAEGKVLTGANGVFDFQIRATTTGVPIYYEIMLEKMETSTLDENVVKVYLTEAGETETEVLDPINQQAINTYDKLGETSIEGMSGKTLYQGEINPTVNNLTKDYRLRMWLSEEADTIEDGEWIYGNKTFTVKVNVYASNDMLPLPKVVYQDSSGANYPELIEGLIPVTWNGSNWVKADTSTEWYNYDTQMWANAVTVTSASRSEYNSAAANTIISMDDIETMWVWIPRYSYTIQGTPVFTSNNSNQNSTTATSTFTFTPTESGILSFTYDMQSETNCDKFTAKLNLTTLVNARCGTYSNQSVTANVTAGTSYTLTLQYSKDGSQSLGTDNVTVYNLSIPGVNVDSLTDTSTGSYKFVKSSYGVQGYGGSAVSQSTPGAIDIKFIDVDTKETGCAAYSGTSPENYRTPDGFTFGTQELPGIWVAKFETSSTNPSASYGGGDRPRLDPLVKPDVTSWRAIHVSNAFTVSQKLTAEGNRYGLDTNADGHMMKNSEWGLVAYLSQSKYGKYGNEDYSGTNKEVYKNNSSRFYTGRSQGSAPPSSGSSSAGSYTYEEEGSGTGASTTGTIYGVYDMSGGSYEDTMSNYNGTIGEAGFSSLPDSKYYDRYTNSDTHLDYNGCNGGVCYGHALSETSGWYSDYASMVSSSRLWARRGGSDSDGSDAGVFSFSPTDGTAFSSYSFRLVLAPGA